MFELLKLKVAIAAARLLPAGLARRFVREQDGVAAVEFGLVAIPFFALMFAIIETGMVFFASQTLETAVADASRLIMTGQAQTQGFSQAQFKEAICSRIYGMFNCASGIQIDVRTAAAFGSTNMGRPVDA